MAKSNDAQLATNRNEADQHDLSQIDLGASASGDVAASGLSETTIPLPKEFSKLRLSEPNADMTKVNLRKGPSLDTFQVEQAEARQESKTNNVSMKSVATGKPYSVSLGSGTLLDRLVTWLAVQIRKAVDQLLSALGFAPKQRQKQEEEEELEELHMNGEVRQKKEWSGLVESHEKTSDPAYVRSQEN